MNEPMTLRLDADTLKRLDQLARTTERSRSAVATEAVRQFLEINERQIAVIQKGVHQADGDQFIDHAKLKAKWEKELAVAMNETCRMRPQ